MKAIAIDRFSNYFYFYPFSIPAKPNRTVLRVISVALMIFTLGITHLLFYIWHKNRNVRVLPSDSEDKAQQTFHKTIDVKPSSSDLDISLTPSTKEQPEPVFPTEEEEAVSQSTEKQDPLLMTMLDSDQIIENLSGSNEERSTHNETVEIELEDVVREDEEHGVKPGKKSPFCRLRALSKKSRKAKNRDADDSRDDGELMRANVEDELRQLRATGNVKLKEYQHLNELSKKIHKKLSKGDSILKDQLKQNRKAQIEINGQAINLIKLGKGKIYATIPENMGGHIGTGDFKNVDLAINASSPKKGKYVSAMLIGTIPEKEIRIQKALLQDGVPYIAKIYTKNSNTDDDEKVASVSVMKYYHLGTLKDNVSSLSFSQKKDIALKLAVCMYEMHTRCVFYRDFKLENVLLDENKDPNLADFGISESYGFLGEKELGPNATERAKKADVLQFGEMLGKFFEEDGQPEIKEVISRMTADFEDRILAEDVIAALQAIID